MRSLAAALTLSLALSAVPARARAIEDTRMSWGRSDTNLHIGMSFATSLAGTEFLKWKGMSKPKATLLSSAVVLVGGLFKEFVIDTPTSGSDLMANGVGVGAHALFQFSVRF